MRSSRTLSPSFPWIAFLKQSVLSKQARHVSGVDRRPSFPMGNTVSSFAKQCGGLSFEEVILICHVPLFETRLPNSYRLKNKITVLYNKHYFWGSKVQIGFEMTPMAAFGHQIPGSFEQSGLDLQSYSSNYHLLLYARGP